MQSMRSAGRGLEARKRQPSPLPEPSAAEPTSLERRMARLSMRFTHC